jgi:excisionase family DNA binding protein
MSFAPTFEVNMKKIEYLSPRDAAIRLGIGLNAVYALLWAGKLQATRSDNRWQIPCSAVEDRIRKAGAK